MKKSLGKNQTNANRIFYLALPPTVYTSVTELLSNYCKAPKYVLIVYN